MDRKVKAGSQSWQLEACNTSPSDNTDTWVVQMAPASASAFHYTDGNGERPALLFTRKPVSSLQLSRERVNIQRVRYSTYLDAHHQSPCLLHDALAHHECDMEHQLKPSPVILRR